MESIGSFKISDVVNQMEHLVGERESAEGDDAVVGVYPSSSAGEI